MDSGFFQLISLKLAICRRREPINCVCLIFYTTFIENTLHSFMHIPLCILLKKNSCFPPPKAAAIDSLQAQGLGTQLPQHCRALLEEGHPLQRESAHISHSCKGNPPRLQHRKCLDEHCCQMHAQFMIYLPAYLYQCKFLSHISHLHLLSGKGCWCWVLLSTTCKIVAAIKSIPHHSGLKDVNTQGLLFPALTHPHDANPPHHCLHT